MSTANPNKLKVKDIITVVLLAASIAAGLIL